MERRSNETTTYITTAAPAPARIINSNSNSNAGGADGIRRSNTHTNQPQLVINEQVVVEEEEEEEDNGEEEKVQQWLSRRPRMRRSRRSTLHALTFPSATPTLPPPRLTVTTPLPYYLSLYTTQISEKIKCHSTAN